MTFLVRRPQTDRQTGRQTDRQTDRSIALSLGDFNLPDLIVLVFKCCWTWIAAAAAVAADRETNRPNAFEISP
jgi:hypothetical protein